MPRKILSMDDRKIVMAACGFRYTIFLDNAGKLCHIGALRPFRPKTEPEINMIMPKDLEAYIKDDLSSSTTFVKICSGYEHCLAADSSGRLFSWGEGSTGCMGTYLVSIKEPTQIKDLDTFGVIDFCCGPDFSCAILDPNGTDPNENIYHNFRYDNVENVKNKLIQVNKKAKAHVRHQMSHNTLATESEDDKQLPKSKAQLEGMIEKFLDTTDLAGFGSMRQDSRRLMLNQVIGAFLKDELNIEQFSNDYLSLTELCESLGVSFEQIFYSKIMTDPQVQKDVTEIERLKGFVVALR